MRYAILWALRVSSDLTENATRAKGSHKMMNNNNIGRVAPLLFARHNRCRMLLSAPLLFIVANLFLAPWWRVSTTSTWPWDKAPSSP